MSVVSRQSEPLVDLEAMRAEADRLADDRRAAAAPETATSRSCSRFDSVEFWANGKDRLHERLRYDRGEEGWTVRRLQP